MTKIFISGSITISKIDEQIKTRLYNIIRQNHIVLIGDANGADKAVQSYLAEKKYSKVNIYCSGQICRNNLGNWQVVNVAVPSNVRGREFYMVKDKQMAIDSNYGFMLWDGKSAGTLNNLLNLITNNKTGLIYLFFKKSFNTIKDIASFEDFINQCNQNDIDNINKKISFRQKLAIHNQPVQEQLLFDVVKEEPATSYNTQNIKNSQKNKLHRPNKKTRKQSLESC